MRNLIDIIHVLTESTGLAGRKPGDKFKNANGDEIIFSNIEFYPRDGGKFDGDKLNKLLLQLPNVKWQNNKTSKSGGVAVATFNAGDREIQFGFFKDNIKPDATSNYIPNEVAGYRFAGKAAEKIKSGLTPQDLLTKRDNLTSEEIINQLIEKLGNNNPLVDLAIKVASGAKFPIKFAIPPNTSFTGFRDYFCEILQPMALQVGSYTGNAGEAAEIFLGGSFAGTLISFDSAKNAGLSDSILTNNEGKSVKVSTKGGKGAEASSKNLIDSVNELQETAAGRKLIAKYKESIDLMREIQSQGQVKAPLYLAVKYNIITQDEADTILRLRNMKPINLKDIDKMKLGKNLTKLAKGRDTDNPESVNLFYHLLASVATLAAIEVNDKTDFSKAASDILNNGALVQVYTKAKQDKDNWVLESFDTVYPGSSIKGVYLSASKNYFSTGIKGNFTFKIDKGTGPKKDTDHEKTGTFSHKEKEVDLAKAAKKITQGASKPISMKPKTSKGIGRQKRK
jgi:hypothetical protein